MRNREDFEDWLRENSSLMDRSISLYGRTIDCFNTTASDDSIESINRFVTSSFRSRRSFYMKYAFRYYLKFLGREEDYKKLVAVKVRPKERKGIYLPQDKLLEIVNSIEDSTFRIVALIQALTGARAHDVLSFKSGDEKLNDDGRLILNVVPKGENEVLPLYIPRKYQEVVIKFIASSKDYPFLMDDDGEITTRTNTTYTYYYQALKKAAAACGVPEFSTHDFRRSFIKDAFDKTKNILLVSKAVGHKRIETTRRYIDIDEDEKTEMVDDIRG